MNWVSHVFSDLHPEEGDGGEEVHRTLEVLQFLGATGGEVVPVHGEVDTQGVMQLVQQLHELLFLQKGSKNTLLNKLYFLYSTEYKIVNQYWLP